MVKTPLGERFGMTVPVIQAPMAGGPTTPDLVVAVGEAGGLGFLAAAYSTPEQIRQMSGAVRERTRRPFGINLFAPLPEPVAEAADVERAIALLAPIHEELGLAPPELPTRSHENFDDQLAAALESGAAALSFTFGLLPEAAMVAARERGMFVIGTATTAAEAALLEQAGVDAVVAQGSEAGAHRGTFAGRFEDAMVGTMALVPQVVEAVRVPVIASGGIMDGRGIVAALTLGAQAVQMGTAFLDCPEAGTSKPHREALRAATGERTRLTRAFSGRHARGIINRFLELGEAVPEAILPYPLQNALTRPMRTAAGAQGKADYLSLWAGQGVASMRSLPAGRLMVELAAEMEAAQERLGKA